jgi:hypothetical protein
VKKRLISILIIAATIINLISTGASAYAREVDAIETNGNYPMTQIDPTQDSDTGNVSWEDWANRLTSELG